MMPTFRTLRIPVTLATAALLLATSPGCAHRREAYYPNQFGDNSRGVHVRAPFVDVHVKGNPKSDRDTRLSRKDDDRDEDDRDEDRD